MGYTGSATIAELQKRAQVRADHQCRPVRKPRPRRGDHARGAQLSDALSHDARRAAAGGDRNPRRSDRLGRATTGRRPTRSSRAISSSGAMPGRRIAGRCASSCSGRSGDRAERPESGRAAVLGLAEDEPELMRSVRRAARARTGRDRRSRRARGRGSGVARFPSCRRWSTRRMAGAARARAARPARQCRARPRATRLLDEFPGAEPTPLSPWGIRLPPDSRSRRPSRVHLDGLVEVQDEGSQLIALACAASGGRASPRPVRGRRRQGACAGRGGAGRADPRDRQQPRPPVEACPTRRAGGRRDRNAAC